MPGASLKLLARSLVSRPSFGGHVILTTGTNTALAGLGLLTGSLAARLLGPEGRGQLAAIQMWPNVLVVLASLGLPQALTYYAAQSATEAGRYLGSAIVLFLLSSVPFMAAGYLILPHVLSVQSVDVVAAARWYLLLLPIQALIAMPQHLLRGRSDFAVWNLLRLAPGLGWLGILSVGWLFGWADPPRFAMMYLALLALLMLPTFQVVRGRVTPPFRPDVQQWQPMLAYGVPTVLSGVPQLLNLRLDQLLMAAFLPAQTLGLYVVAVTWSSGVAQLPNALGTVLLPRTAAQPDSARREAVFSQGIRLAVLAALPIGVAVAFITPWVLPWLFGEKFSASVPAALVLVGAAVISALNMVLEEGLRGLGQPATALWAELAGLAVTAIALFLLLRPFGIMGAAVGSLLGYSAVTIALTASVRRLTRHPLSMLFWPSQHDVRRIRDHLRLRVTEAAAKEAG